MQRSVCWDCAEAFNVGHERILKRQGKLKRFTSDGNMRFKCNDSDFEWSVSDFKTFLTFILGMW